MQVHIKQLNNGTSSSKSKFCSFSPLYLLTYVCATSYQLLSDMLMEKLVPLRSLMSTELTRDDVNIISSRLQGKKVKRCSERKRGRKGTRGERGRRLPAKRRANASETKQNSLSRHGLHINRAAHSTGMLMTVAHRSFCRCNIWAVCWRC